ncbi:MAG: heme-binding protein [Deltaproteobacteria bacterium]|jgi:uncharacterized protein GlcG (DUF336 family)|nr:heme-binding protein [Deltaproteobacteria bacterium]
MRKVLLTGLLALILSGGAMAYSVGAYANDDPGRGLYLPSDITLAQAQLAIEAGLKVAKERGLLMDIAIVDAGGNLKAFVRMNGAFLASVDIAIKKAKTARGLNMPTSDLHRAAVPGGELYGIEATNGGMVIFGGGELIKNLEGTIIGAIGVSGDSVANDTLVAQAGAKAVLKSFMAALKTPKP